MHKHVGRDNPDKIIIDGAIPPIISKEVFSAVADRMKSNRAKRRTSYREYLLSGLIRCGECGSSMSGITTVSKGRSYTRYVCLGKRTAKKCDLKNVDAHLLDTYIRETVVKQILSEDAIQGAARRLAATLAKESCMADDIRVEMQRLAAKNSALTDLVLETGLTPEYKQRLIDYEQHRQQLEARLAAVVEPAPISEEELVAILRDDCARLASDPGCLDELVRRYVQSVAVYTYCIEIVYALDLSKNEKKHPSDESDRCNIGWLPRYAPIILYTQKISRSSIPA